MRHLTEDELAGYAFDPEEAPTRAAIEDHLATCAECEDRLEFIHSVERDLTDPETWTLDEERRGTREAIRDLAARIAAEDARSAELLRPMIDNPARAAWANLGSRRKYRTAGVVRLLLRTASRAVDREPLDALTFADAAIDVAARLTGYANAVVYELQGTAWKERANALATLGRFDASLEALDHAERAFRKVPGDPLGLAIVEHARGIVYYAKGDLSRAYALLERSAAAYASVGETDRYMRARHMIANIRFGEGDIVGAKTIYEEILGWAEDNEDASWIGREANTLGRCEYELRDFNKAVQHFQRSLKAFGDLGLAAEAIRPAWGIGLVILGSGKPAPALERFTAVSEEFHRRGMFVDEALVALDMMEALHVLGRHREIVALASSISQTFTNAGMLTSALTALAYVKEAATHGTLTPHRLAHVREFITRLERQPALLFSPPSD